MQKEWKKIIIDLINHDSEEEWFEFKVNWYEPYELGEYISALSNAAALEGQEFAYFVWGIENDTHEVKGTSFNFQQDVKNEPLQHFLARTVRPDIGFSFKEIKIDGKRIVVLSIPAASKTPTAFNKTRFIRIGSSKANLMDYPERESQLFNILRNGFPTIDNTESEYQNLTFNKLFVYYETKGITLRKQTFKKNLGFVTNEGKYNILAQLLSDNSHIPIRFSLFTGKNKASEMYSVREFGNTCLLYSLDDVLRYGEILNIPQADERNRVVERKEVMLFNNSAFREAIINAFVHNRWIDGNAPMFTGFQDRIEILSRGKLPPGQTLEGFYAGESVPVNQKLSDIFLQLHISERTGRGIPKITEIYGRDHIKINDNSIVVTIPYERLGEEVYGVGLIGNAQVKLKNAQVKQKNAQVNAQVKQKNAQVNAQVNAQKNLLVFCSEPKSLLEIAEYLGYKDRRSVRKILNKLIDVGQLAMTIPDKPNSRNQKYICIK